MRNPVFLAWLALAVAYTITGEDAWIAAAIALPAGALLAPHRSDT